MTKFQQNVAVLSILKEVFVLADVLVFQSSVNFNLRLQLGKGKKYVRIVSCDGRGCSIIHLPFVGLVP